MTLREKLIADRKQAEVNLPTSIIIQDLETKLRNLAKAGIKSTRFNLQGFSVCSQYTGFFPEIQEAIRDWLTRGQVEFSMPESYSFQIIIPTE